MTGKTKSPPIELSEEMQKLYDERSKVVRDNCDLNRKIFQELLSEAEGDYYSMPKTPDKPALGKSGAQKYLMFYNHQEKTDVRVEMFNETPMFRGKCVITDYNGEFVSNGCSAQYPKKGNVDFALNAAAKMCEKRAFVDAVVNAYSLSFLFTMDRGTVEDDVKTNEEEEANSKGAAKKSGTKSAQDKKEEWENYLNQLDEQEAEVIRGIAAKIKGAKTEEELAEVGAEINESVDETDEFVMNTLRRAFATRQRQIKQRKGK